jgi:excisionase family DNA binding protein
MSTQTLSEAKITLAEAGKLLDLSEKTVRRYIKNGRINKAGVGVGQKILLSLEDIQKFAAEWGSALVEKRDPMITIDPKIEIVKRIEEIIPAQSIPSEEPSPFMQENSVDNTEPDPISDIAEKLQPLNQTIVLQELTLEREGKKKIEEELIETRQKHRTLETEHIEVVRNWQNAITAVHNYQRLLTEGETRHKQELQKRERYIKALAIFWGISIFVMVIYVLVERGIVSIRF